MSPEKKQVPAPITKTSPATMPQSKKVSPVPTRLPANKHNKATTQGPAGSKSPVPAKNAPVKAKAESK